MVGDVVELLNVEYGVEDGAGLQLRTLCRLRYKTSPAILLACHWLEISDFGPNPHFNQWCWSGSGRIRIHLDPEV